MLSRHAELRLLFFFTGFVATFLIIRVSVRLIRANVRWWPGNVSAGGVHIHHMVFGVVLMVLSGVTGAVLDGEVTGWRLAAAAAFGVGTALVLDEFALILHLDDVYWSRQGRVSVDAIFLVVGLSGLLLLGARPLGFDTVIVLNGSGERTRLTTVLGYLYVAPMLCFVVITLLKGKIWSGVLGLLVPVLAIVGSIRLARPGSPWARWFYAPVGCERALRRDTEIRARVMRIKTSAQDLVAGRPDE